jgi:hypothetical protein
MNRNWWKKIKMFLPGSATCCEVATSCCTLQAHLSQTYWTCPLQCACICCSSENMQGCHTLYTEPKPPVHYHPTSRKQHTAISVIPYNFEYKTPSNLRCVQFLKEGFRVKKLESHIYFNLPYILESNPHLVFATFLNEKKLVRASNPYLSFNRPLPTGRLFE